MTLEIEILLSLILYFSLLLWTTISSKYVSDSIFKFNKNCYLRNHIILSILIGLPFIFLYGFRYGVGTDYFNYLELYIEYQNYNSIIDCLSIFKQITNEPLFKLINYLSIEYFVCIIIIGIIIYYFVFKSIIYFNRYNRLWLSLFIALFTIFIYATNTVRMSLSLSIVFYSTYFLFNNKIKKFLLGVFIAFLFHKTALLALSFFFLKEFKNTKLNKIRNILMYLLIITSPIIIKDILKILYLIPVASFYMEKYGNSIVYTPASPLNGLIKILPIILLIIIFHNTIIKKDRRNILLCNLVFCKIPFVFLSKYLRWGIRLGRYFSIFEIILLPMIVYSCKNKGNRLLLTFYIIVYYISVFIYSNLLQGDQGIFPYRFIFDTWY